MIFVKIFAITILLLNCVYDNEGHHLTEHILNHHKKCSMCEIKWVPYLQDYPMPNMNARICRAMKDRYIVGELHLDKNRRSFCKIPFYNRAENIYQFEILNINGKEIRELYSGNVNDLPGDHNSNDYNIKCSHQKLHDILKQLGEKQ